MTGDRGNQRSILAALMASSFVAVVAAQYFVSRRLRLDCEQKLEQMERLRAEERRGRIRAEVKLRTTLKEQNQQSKSSTNETFVMEQIGTAISPYTKRMGTPRQAQLCPSSRGVIQLTVPPACMDGISEYSHLWIIFEFHANTNVDRQKTKIRPPRSPRKVGQLATRSPHRPNPVGLSLVAFHHWDEKAKQLHVRGVDLVNGTPIYDIKPCVPWDTVAAGQILRVPSWVSQEDTISSVEFTKDALYSLKEFLDDGRLAPLYNEDDAEAVHQTLREILAQDPRSSHKGVEARGSEGSYNLVFGQCRVYFSNDESSGILVTKVEAVEFKPESYVDGVPLVSEQR